MIKEELDELPPALAGGLEEDKNWALAKLIIWLKP